MIKVQNLKMEYKQLLFNNLAFVLGNQEKVGLVGLNGCGKSTLLKILAKVEIPDSGSIEIVNEKLEYLPQEYSFDEELLIGEFLESLVNFDQTQIFRVNKILGKLNFTDIDWFQTISTLSEGQKMKLYLTKLLVSDPTILLLDEPTNHLDIYGIMWLEKFIKTFEGICIIVSHDREFLNNVCNKIFEIEEHTLRFFEGNYNNYINQKAEYIEERERLFKAQERKREQLDKLLENARKIKDGKKRSSMVSAAKHRMEREVTRVEMDEYKELKLSNLNLAGQVHKTKKMLDIKNLNFSYTPDKQILKNANFQSYGNEKVWFFGPNGVGKTTFVKLIIGELKQQSGDILFGQNISWAYFSQDQSHLDKSLTIEEYFLQKTNISYNQSFGLMEKFLFPKEMCNTKIEKLSPGRRARLSFAVFAQKEYELLILDEPTNHLDIKSKEVIEEAFRNYKGAMILISHDRYFVNSIGMDRYVTLEGGKIVELKSIESVL